MRFRSMFIGAAWLCAACADSSGGSETSFSSVSDGGSLGDGDGDGDADDSGDGDGDGDDSGGGTKLDVSAGGDGGAESSEEDGCKGIDFLFVVDNSGSMKEEQEALIASFPGFVDAMEEKVAEFDAADFHIMVADTDSVRIEDPHAFCSFECADDPNGLCSDGTPCAFSSDVWCLNTCKDDIQGTCDNGDACLDLMQCEACECENGAGVIDDLDGNPCGVAGGKRYIQDGQPQLDQTFACLAEVGTEGSGDENQAFAVTEALSPQLNANSGCNSGFVRDDSILVVTVITDEEDGPDPVGSPGEPAQWVEDVIAAKYGNADAVVVLGLLGDGGQPNGVCSGEDGADGAYSPRLHDFVESFPRHVVESVCEPSYDQFFLDAVDLIGDTCEDYMPPEG